MPVILEVPCDGSTHRLTVSTATAKRLASLPVDRHAAFTEGLLGLIRSHAPKEAPKASLLGQKPVSKPRRKPKPQEKKRALKEEMEVPVTEAREPTST
jgi:hypothetical protein